MISNFDGKKNQHSIVKKVSKKDILQEEYFEPTFSKTEIDSLKKFAFFGVFSYLQISLLDNDEEEFDISLNQRFTEVPYFVIRVKNPNVKGLLTPTRNSPSQ